MGTRSKGPHRYETVWIGGKGYHQKAVTYRYKSTRWSGQESKLARRIRRKHTRGRDFHRVLGYQFANKYRTIGALTGRREPGPKSRAKRFR